MKAENLLREGKLDEAIEALGSHLRDNPGEARSRTFLFELLCFRGEFERARKHLAMLSRETNEAMVGALLYEGALHAEETRQQMFRDDVTPSDASTRSIVTGELNGKPFASLADADPRIGARLEVFAAGDYLWIPFEHIASIRMEPPKRLRDLLWAPALLRTGPQFKDRDLGQVLLPVLTPGTSSHPDSAVRLGRVTEWCSDENGRELPYGAKMLLVDGEEFPFLELREMTIHSSQEAVQ